MINENPDLAVQVGADGTGRDALGALQLAEDLVRCVAVSDLNLR